MKTLLCDSSVYIAALNSQDIFCHQTQKFTLELQKKTEVEIIIPTLVVLEVANISKKPIEKILFLFEENLILDLDISLVKEIIPFLAKINLKTSDAIIAGIAKIYEADLISWDKRLIKEGRKIVKSFTPTEYLKKGF